MILKPIIVPAPSSLGLISPGVQCLPRALVQCGLATKLGATVADGVVPPAYDESIDPETKFRNVSQVADYSRRLGKVVGGIIQNGGFPLVLGGDCTVALGCMAGFAQTHRGQGGLLYLDGHTDSYIVPAHESGEMANSVFRLIRGYGPDSLTALHDRKPYVRESHAVLFGCRDLEQSVREGAEPIQSSVACYTCDSIQTKGIEETTQSALGRLPTNTPFWMHLDADVLDDAVMPAVDYRMPGGLSPHELVYVMRSALQSGRCVGMNVTIYNPKLDPNRKAGGVLTDCLVKSFATGGN